MQGEQTLEQLQMQMQVQMQAQMQMAQFAHMQMFGMAAMQAQMQMQMVPCMQMVPSMPVPLVPVLPVQASAEGSEFLGCSTEDANTEELLGLSERELGERISVQTVEARDAETEAKRMVAAGAFVGTLARFDHDLGFGFVVCPECAEQWGKHDIYIGQKNVVESGLELGDVVEFRVEDNNGKPRVAMNPKVLQEPTKHKQLLSRLKSAAKTVSLSNKRNAAQMSTFGTMPVAKRPHVGNVLDAKP